MSELQVRQQVDLGKFNTLGLPCTAGHYIAIHDENQLELALQWASKRDKATLVLGDGSNLVLPRELDALVLHMVNRGLEIQEGTQGKVAVTVAAGENWHGLVKTLLGRGIFGLENLALIPGTAGAAPVQNIGAYGVELERFVTRVRAYDVQQRQWLELSARDCGFSYRNSLFRGDDRFIITGLDMQLSRIPQVEASYQALRQELEQRGIRQPTPEDIFAAVVRVRQSKLPDPAVIPNVGSFFKNPIIEASHHEQLQKRYPGLVSYPQEDGRFKLAAGWLIEQCGYKGANQNGVGMHEEQALVLVNRGGATAERVLQFAASVQASVGDRFGVKLQREPLVFNSRGELDGDRG